VHGDRSWEIVCGGVRQVLVWVVLAEHILQSISPDLLGGLDLCKNEISVFYVIFSLEIKNTFLENMSSFL
jgi:hypothetical protein